MRCSIIILVFFIGVRCDDAIDAVNRTVRESNFMSGQVLCDVVDRLSKGCSIEKTKVRSPTECPAICSEDASCVGYSLDEKKACFHHKLCPSITECTTESTNHRYMSKYCGHGSWNTLAKSCDCMEGFHGERCQLCHQSCSQLKDAGYSVGKHIVYLDHEQGCKKPFRIRCSVKARGDSFIFLLRNTGERDLNKTWGDYVHGFFLDNDNFFIGLYSWYRLYSTGCDNIKFLLQFLTRGGAKVYREYEGFALSDEKDGYSFNFQKSRKYKESGVPKGSVFGECLLDLQNIPFSAWDTPNSDLSPDAVGNICAAWAGSGWWHHSDSKSSNQEPPCHNPCNVFGFGPRYFDTMEDQRLMSLKGTNLSALSSSDKLSYQMYFLDC